MAPKIKNRKFVFTTMIAGLAFWQILSCGRPIVNRQTFTFTGTTMGTSYHITVISDSLDLTSRSNLAHQVDSLLNVFNHKVSTFDEQSEISRFNRNQTRNPIPVSQDLLQIVQTGLDFCNASGGAFDITVMPIVNFYGFGFEPGENRFPTVQEIDNWLDLTGCDRLSTGDSTLSKMDPRVSIDLSAIAKGDGVDRVADFLVKQGYTDNFVEIGGEIMTHGFNAKGKHWRVGIDRPNFDGAPGADLEHVIRLSGMAVASSGDYRNYREIEGKRVTHTIDPRNGSPISHNLAAVTVVYPTCLIADGLATTTMVLGPKDGLEWLEAYPGAEGLLITREADGSFKEYMTSGFRVYLDD